MPLLKLITETISQNSQILVTYSNTPLGQEISRQLKSYSYVDTISVSDSYAPLPPLQSLSAIIHLAAVTDPSLERTLSHTNQLYQLLQLSFSKGAKLIFVVSNSRSHLCQTSIALINQYVKNHPLSWEIIEIDPNLSRYKLATIIIQRCIHNHQSSQIPPASHEEVILFTKYPKINIRFKSYLLVICLVIIVPWIIFLLINISLFFSTLCISSSLSDLSLTKLLTCAQITKNLSNILKIDTKITIAAEPLLSTFGLPADSVFTLTNGLANTIIQSYAVNEEASKELSKIINLNSDQPEIEIISTRLSLLNESLSLYQSELNQIYQNTFRFNSLLTQIAQQVSLIRQTVGNSQLLIPGLPELLAFHKTKHYLILIQDNTRITATGGYLDTLAYFTLSDGRLTQFEIFTSQSADSRLLGQVTSPFDFKAATHKSTWSLRDSNWDPDFPTTAKRIAWFIEKELSRPVDVVISLNLDALSALKTTLIPNSPNLKNQYLQTLKTNSSDRFIFRSFESIYEQLRTLPSSRMQILLPEILELFQTRQIQVFPLTFSSPGLNQVGWSGQVKIPDCRSSLPCLTDYVYITNSNLSSTNLDAYINHTVNISTAFQPKNITSSIEINYQLPDSSTSGIDESYQTYLRVYLSPKYVVNNIYLNDQILDTRQYTVSDSHGLKLISLPLKIQPGSSSKLQINTSQPLSLSRFHYQIDLPNQPGVTPYPVTLNFSYPKEWFSVLHQLGNQFSPSVASPGLVRYNASTTKNITVDLDLSI